MKIAVGDKVRLRSGGLYAIGMLHNVFLYEEGYDGPVPVIEVEGGKIKVRLPSGYELDITEKDIEA